MTKRWNSTCLNCIVKKHLTSFPADAPEEQKLTYMNELFQILLNAKDDQCGAVISEKIRQLKKRLFGITQDFSEIKHTFNQLMLSLEDEIYQKITDSENLLYTALQYVMAANYIDFGALKDVSKEKLLSLLSEAQSRELPKEAYEKLKSDLENSKTCVVLTDNCGEIVLDKVMIRILKKLYPDLHIEVIVRGLPASNDATIEDAIEVGLCDLVPVTGNGTAYTGTYLPEISNEALTLLQNADLIIAKGMGNFESMNGCGLNIYYLFLCKCEMFINRFHAELFDGMLIREMDL